MIARLKSFRLQFAAAASTQNVGRGQPYQIAPKSSHARILTVTAMYFEGNNYVRIAAGAITTLPYVALAYGAGATNLGEIEQYQLGMDIPIQLPIPPDMDVWAACYSQPAAVTGGVPATVHLSVSDSPVGNDTAEIIDGFARTMDRNLREIISRLQPQPKG